MNNPVIVGAGLAGLIAAQVFQRAPLYESQPEARSHHRALLRFRSDAVSKLTGIEFNPVTVRKGIWMRGELVPPSIRLANLYSYKVLKRHESERSIWNLEPVTRYIAPEDLYEQMVALAGKRINWGTMFSSMAEGDETPFISTIPLPVVLKAVAFPHPLPEFHRAPITVERFRIADCDLYQTIYFPDPSLNEYRASITKDLLIIEGAGKQTHCHEVMQAFGIGSDRAEPMDSGVQEYGKIVPLPHHESQQLLGYLTVKHNIYSLGRFATWRNLLLDDVVQDAATIFRLMRMSSYGKTLHFSKSP